MKESVGVRIVPDPSRDAEIKRLRHLRNIELIQLRNLNPSLKSFLAFRNFRKHIIVKSRNPDENTYMDFDEVYRHYYNRVLRYLGTIVGLSEAEDLAQDVFVKVSSKLPKLKDESKVSSWIFKIALNTARDRLRQPSGKNLFQIRPPSPKGEIAPDAVEQVSDTQSRTPEDQAIRAQMIQCYVDFVKKLPRNYYDVYVLSEFDGLPDKTISEKLSIPLERVKIRLHRARTRLYEELRTNCRCYYNERGELMGYPK